ncbi:MAG TPA: ribosome-associated translation inhibitor RaiA [Alphaproteobacteria bacterium]|nr:ribosome-associated translation inhibitor RaiA [Alphaproteobacteria bacterium]
MQLPLQITFRNIGPSSFVRARVRERADQLERFFDRITSCRVVIEAPNRRRRRGKLYKVSVDVKVPRGEIAATRNPAAHHAHEDVYVAIRDAFDAIERRLEDHARRRRGDVKPHVSPSVAARIESVFKSRGYGFLKTSDGEKVYFNRNALSGDFSQLAVGRSVRCAIEEGDKGLQATFVKPSPRRATASAASPTNKTR